MGILPLFYRRHGGLLWGGKNNVSPFLPTYLLQGALGIVLGEDAIGLDGKGSPNFQHEGVRAERDERHATSDAPN